MPKGVYAPAMREAIEQICEKAGWTTSGNEILVPLGEGRKQKVEVEEYEARGVSFIRLFSRLGRVGEVDGRGALGAVRLNWALPYGAGAGAALTEGGGETLLLCDSFGAERLHEAPDRVTLAIGYLAETADNFERSVFGRDEH